MDKLGLDKFLIKFMNKQKIILLIVVVIVLVGGVFVSRYIKGGRASNETVQGRTDNWATYTNSVTKYQVQYPSSWEVEEMWKTRKGYGDLYSQEGVTVSFKSKQNSESLVVTSSPLPIGEFYCWNFLAEEKIKIGNFDAKKTIYTPERKNTEGINCAEDPPQASMRRVQVTFRRPTLVLPGFKPGVDYELVFQFEDSNLVLIDTILSTFQPLSDSSSPSEIK